MGQIPQPAEFEFCNVSPFVQRLMAQKNNEPDPGKSVWSRIKAAPRKALVLAFAGAAAVGGQGYDKAQVALWSEFMAHSDWKTTGGIRIQGETDHKQFYFLGAVTGKTSHSYFITNDADAKARPGEEKIVTDYPFEALTKAGSIVGSLDRVTDVNGSFERTIKGQRGMNGQLNTPVNGIRINMETLQQFGKTQRDMAKYLDVIAFDALETQVKTVGIPHTYPVYRYQIWEQQIHLRNMFLEQQDKAMEDINSARTSIADAIRPPSP